jgi:hypothetical protein
MLLKSFISNCYTASNFAVAVHSLTILFSFVLYCLYAHSGVQKGTVTQNTQAVQVDIVTLSGIRVTAH